MSEPNPRAGRAPFDVFISYSSVDKSVADAVCATLEAAGIRCWIAPRDILPGVDWGSAIVEALGRCRLLVLVFSASANESPQIRNELVQAVHKGSPILPFRIEATTPTKSLAYFMDGVHWLDALTPPLEAHLQTLVVTAQALLQAGEAGHAPDVPRPPSAIAAARAAAASPRRAPFWPIVALAVALAVAVAGVGLWFGLPRHAAVATAGVQVFSLPSEQDLQRVRDAAAAHGLILPTFSFRPPKGDADRSALRFVGVWASELGYNGIGRQAMLIITAVSGDLGAEGFLLGGPPTPTVFDPNIGPYTLPFVGKIDGDTLSGSAPNASVSYVAKLNLQSDALVVSVNRPDGKRASIVLKAIWRLASGA